MRVEYRPNTLVQTALRHDKAKFSFRYDPLLSDDIPDGHIVLAQSPSHLCSLPWIQVDPTKSAFDSIEAH